MFDHSPAKPSFQSLGPSLRLLIASAPLMASAAACAQQAATTPSANSPASQSVSVVPDRSNTWTAPPGSQITVDRRSGRISITLPVQPTDGSREQALRFADWSLHPYAGSGPYPAVREEPASLPTHTVYRPADLSKAPKLPVLLWANGGCRNTSVEFTRFLGELASHGYLVIAIGRSDIPFLVIHGSIAAVANEKDANGNPLIVSDPAVLIKGLEWAISENSRKDSVLYGRVDTSKVATIGQSCGGPQAFRAAKDPRITTVVALNSSFPTQAAPGMVGGADDGWTAEKLAIPAACLPVALRTRDLAAQSSVIRRSAPHCPCSKPVSIRLATPAPIRCPIFAGPAQFWRGSTGNSRATHRLWRCLPARTAHFAKTQTGGSIQETFLEADRGRPLDPRPAWRRENRLI